MIKHISISIIIFILGFNIVYGQELTPEQMEEMMTLAQPGPEHKMLEKLVGTGPDSKIMDETRCGTCRNEGEISEYDDPRWKISAIRCNRWRG